MPSAKWRNNPKRVAIRNQRLDEALAEGARLDTRPPIYLPGSGLSHDGSLKPEDVIDLGVKVKVRVWWTAGAARSSR